MVLPERPRAENTLTIICQTNSGVREVEEAGDTAVDVLARGANAEEDSSMIARLAFFC